MNTRSGRPRGKLLPSNPPSSENSIFRDSSSSLASSLSSRSSSASSSASASESSASTVVHHDDQANSEREQLEPLPPTPPQAKPTPSPAITKAKLLAQELKSTDVDPSILLLSQLFENRSVSSHQPPPTYAYSNPTDSLVKSIGWLEQGEDLFVFLNRFEYGMKSNSVPPCDWVHILPKLLLAFTRKLILIVFLTQPLISV